MTTGAAPFEALVIRYRHDALLGEAVNVGVIASSGGMVATRFTSTLTRVTALFPRCEKAALRRAMKRLAGAARTANERARELYPTPMTASLLVAETLPRDAHAFCSSEPIVGVTRDLERSCAQLFELYVENRLEGAQRTSRQDEDVWSEFERNANALIRVRLEPHDLPGERMPLHFEHGWKNGRWHVAQPLSFDLLEPHAIRDKATGWVGKLSATKPSAHDAEVSFLIGMPGPDADAEVVKAANDGEAMLRELLSGEAEVYTEAQAGELEAKILADLNAAE